MRRQPWAYITGGIIAGISLLILLSTIASASGINGPAATPASSDAPAIIVVDTATSTPTCAPAGSYRIMIAYSDSLPPGNLRNQLLAEPGVIAADFFNARTSTPTLAQMQQYQIVLAFSNASFANSTTLGNNLADYQDGGGITVITTYAFVSGAPTFSIQGRWLSGGYSPFIYGPNTFADGTLGSYNSRHPLMQGVTSLGAYNRATLGLASDTLKVASWMDHDPLVATKGRAVGISAYLGDNPTNATGQFSRLIVNAGRWLSPPPCAPTPTSTSAQPTATSTDLPTSTDTAVPTSIATSTSIAATATYTSVVPTATVTNTAVASLTSTPQPTHVATSTSTRVASATSTSPPASTHTIVSATSTATSPATSTATEIPPTACPIQYADVLPESDFYPYIRCIACRNVANGYPCGGPGEPCNASNDGYFRPFANITRGQIAKMVSNAAGFSDDPGPQIYEDVPTTQTFYEYINRLANRGFMSGYACGGPGEPCVPNARPFFRPGTNATRGQVSKIVSNTAGIETPIPSTQQTYEDVPYTNPFWLYIERLSDLGVMGGYPCGDLDEPCLPPNNRPYFRPFVDVTRAQTAKIVSNAFFPSCQTP